MASNTGGSLYVVVVVREKVPNVTDLEEEEGEAERVSWVLYVEGLVHTSRGR